MGYLWEARQARTTIRGTKRRDMLIQQQHASTAAASCNHVAFTQKRAEFDLLTMHMSEVHEKQRKNLA